MLLQLSENAERLSVGNPEVADVVLINPREIYLLGKKSGHTNLLVWTAQGSTTLRDISVGADTDSLHAKLREYVPSAENLRVDSVADTLVLSGRVSDGMKVQRLMALTEAFNGNQKVINLLRVHGTQQVMLEVKVAEVSKTLLDELGVDMNLTRTIGNTSVNLLSQLLSAGSTALTAARANGLSTITLTAEMKKRLGQGFGRTHHHRRERARGIVLGRWQDLHPRAPDQRQRRHHHHTGRKRVWRGPALFTHGA